MTRPLLFSSQLSLWFNAFAHSGQFWRLAMILVHLFGMPQKHNAQEILSLVADTTNSQAHIEYVIGLPAGMGLNDSPMHTVPSSYDSLLIILTVITDTSTSPRTDSTTTIIPIIPFLENSSILNGQLEVSVLLKDTADHIFENIDTLLNLGTRLDLDADTVPTGIAKNDQRTHLKMYPNPAEEFIIVNGPVEQPSALRVYSLSGQPLDVPLQRLSDREMRFDVSDLEAGLYMIKTSSGQSSIIVKQ